mgnify:CR=1 FL=1
MSEQNEKTAKERKFSDEQKKYYFSRKRGTSGYSKANSKHENDYSRYAKNCTCQCVVCGDYFKAGESIAMYCSQRCQNDANLERRRERLAAARKKHCNVCKGLFTAQRADAVYCSDACRQKAHRQRSSTARSPESPVQQVKK